MFTIKTKIGPSEIHGTGVFADQFIPKGTVIWVDHPLNMQISEEQIKQLPDVAREYLLQVCYKSFKSGNYVLCFDNCRYTNHSDSPNTAEIRTTDPGEDYDIALKDIQEGEELTLDYRTMDQDFDKKFKRAS